MNKLIILSSSVTSALPGRKNSHFKTTKTSTTNGMLSPIASLGFVLSDINSWQLLSLLVYSGHNFCTIWWYNPTIRFILLGSLGVGSWSPSRSSTVPTYGFWCAALLKVRWQDFRMFYRGTFHCQHILECSSVYWCHLWQIWLYSFAS